MDGARVFNAAAALDVNVSKIASYCDTISFCLSKGLGAPVGSLLCGSSAFIEDARRIRKLLGGGMRQAGILAAAGIYALENNIERLHIDHRNAKALAAALNDTDWAYIDPDTVETNIVCFTTGSKPADTVVKALGDKGILCASMDSNLVRMVTHLNIQDSDIEETIRIIRTVSIK